MQWIKQALSPLLGQRGEKLARHYLEQHGLVCVMQNYRCRSGEIDLIMRQHSSLVFVEVKLRSTPRFGQAVEFFHPAKRRKFESAVAHYLQHQGLNPSQIDHRIDVVGIELTSGGQAQYNWLQNV